MSCRVSFNLVVVLLALSGCTGELNDPGAWQPERDAGESVEDTFNSANSANSMNSTMNVAPDAGSDGMATFDVDQGSNAMLDMGEVEMDMGTTRPDVGPPQWENACESGPLNAPIAGCQPTPLPSTGDVREDCVRRINQFRWECQCLPPLQRWVDGEACADEQALYDSQGNGAHAGFRANICSPRGNAQNECPGWGSWSRVIGGCLQQMWDEGPGEPFEDHGHYINMSSGNYSMVACGEGGGWFIQNFR